MPRPSVVVDHAARHEDIYIKGIQPFWLWKIMTTNQSHLSIVFFLTRGMVYSTGFTHSLEQDVSPSSRTFLPRAGRFVLLTSSLQGSEERTYQGDHPWPFFLLPQFQVSNNPSTKNIVIPGLIRDPKSTIVLPFT